MSVSDTHRYWGQPGASGAAAPLYNVPPRPPPLFALKRYMLSVALRPQTVLTLRVGKTLHYDGDNLNNTVQLPAPDTVRLQERSNVTGRPTLT